jgi:acyl-CoA synthetase (AMP-forming)/AMP-acid ligase II
VTSVVEPGTRLRPPFLGGEADDPALVTAGVTLTYADLAHRVEERRGQLGAVRRLVLLEAANDVESVVTYLAALAGQHPVLMTGPLSETRMDDLLRLYDVDVVQRVGGAIEERRTGSRHELHPDLALLLSTSGSTGSPKLVRLSRDNVLANAQSIAEYLALRPTDRAITSLPIHYCYGLSVLNSHLEAGAAVVLTDLSVADSCFWDLAASARVTTMAGVPYTYELLDACGFADRHLPSLRQLTQAGGRMDPERVVKYAELGRKRGFELFVMYGQTEATARMAFLPPASAASRPASVGIPIPGGDLQIVSVPGETRPAVGELVYTGPNVMMGYAHTADDLARGPELTTLRTGDLARQADDGLWEIVGRVNRYAKVFGLRIDLDDVERQLAERGHRADVVVHGDRVWVFSTRARVAGRIRALVTAFTGLPAGAVAVHRLERLSRTTTGKPDRRCLERHAALLAERVESSTLAADPARIRDLYAAVLGRPDATTDDTFVDLGGDSLSYVEVSGRLADALGTLPPQWPRLTPRQLADVAVPGKPERRLVAVDNTALLRALAITMVVASHADLVQAQGGAHVLLAVAGFNFARFQLGIAGRAVRVRGILAAVAAFAIPAMVWIAASGVVTGSYRPATALLLNGVLGGDTWTDDWRFWFVEALVWIYVGGAVLLSVPALDRWQRRWPFGTSLVALGVALLARFAITGIEAGATGRYSIAVVLWCFALGWAAAVAHTTPRRVLVGVLAAASTIGFFGDIQREAIVVLGVVALLWRGTPRLPAPAAVLVRLVASASLWIYLTHWQIYPWLEDAGHPVLAILASLVVGVAAWRMWLLLSGWLRAWWVVWREVVEDDVALDAAGADPGPTMTQGAAVPGAVRSVGRADVEAVGGPDDPHGGVSGQRVVSSSRGELELGRVADHVEVGGVPAHQEPPAR